MTVCSKSEHVCVCVGGGGGGERKIRLDFDQLCWHNFSIIVFNYSRIIGSGDTFKRVV